MSVMTKTIDDAVTDAEEAQRRATAELEAAERELAATLDAQAAEDLLERPGAMELAHARQRVTTARRAHRAAVEVLAASRARVEREQGAARRQQRQAALRRYLDALDQAAAAWAEVAACGPIPGLAPAMASPEGVAQFRDWTERNVS
jgi:hypothetical protein